MDYATLIADLAIYAQQVAPNAAVDFTAALPLMVSNGELRCLRDLAETINAHGQNTTLVTTPALQLLSLVNLPAQAVNPVVFQAAALAYANPVVVERIDLQVAGAWVPLQRVSLDFLNAIWPAGTSAVPSYGLAWWALVDDVSVMVAPAPLGVYPVRVTGWWRPATLSVSNTQTFISIVYPDLLFASCMLEVTGYQRDFGAQSDDPKMAVSWLQQYQRCLAGARAEEAKRMGLSPPSAPAPQAAAAGA